MNFISCIGVLKAFEKNLQNFKITLKIDRPFNSEKEFDELDVYVDNRIFKNELSIIKENSIIAIKGRIQNEENNIKIIAEHISIF